MTAHPLTLLTLATLALTSSCKGSAEKPRSKTTQALEDARSFNAVNAVNAAPVSDPVTLDFNRADQLNAFIARQLATQTSWQMLTPEQILLNWEQTFSKYGDILTDVLECQVQAKIIVTHMGLKVRPSGSKIQLKNLNDQTFNLDFRMNLTSVTNFYIVVRKTGGVFCDNFKELINENWQVDDLLGTPDIKLKLVASADGPRVAIATIASADLSFGEFKSFQRATLRSDIFKNKVFSDNFLGKNFFRYASSRRVIHKTIVNKLKNP